MNFNLISPSNNGSDFIVQFRDNIEIKSSSKVYLNFCELTRTNNITLIKDSIITVNYNLIPFYKLVDEVWEENKLTVYYTIPKGSYTIQEFKDLINLRMDLDLITDTDERFYYNFIFGSGNSTSSNIPIGYTVGGLPNDPEIDKKWVDTDLTLDTVNIKDFTYVKGTGYTCQSTNPVIGQYTSYGLADTHYWHYLYNDPAQSELNWIKIKTTSNLKDNVCFGLYSTEFMTLPFNTENPRTNGNDLETLYKTDTTYTSLQDIPQGFVLVELQMTSANETQDEPRLKIWIAGNSNTINNGSMQNNIGQMSLVFTKSLTVWFDSSSSMPMKFRTYNKSISEPDFKSDVFFFQLWTDDLNNTLIYDSADDDIFFEKQFFKMAMNQAQFNQDMNDCGIPFKVFLGACALDDGFLSVNYVEFKKGDVVDGVRIPAMIRDLNFSFDDTLKPYMGTSQTSQLYPNNTAELPQQNEQLYFYETDITPDYLNDSYSISIDELPLNSYKNIENSNSGGYSQNIVANIPMPFLNSIASYQTQTNSTLVKGLFSPNVSIVNQMKNKDIRTNKFTVRIRRMKDDTLATELIKSVVNLTIM